VPTFSRHLPSEKRRSLMTGRRNDAGNLILVVAAAAMLVFGALALSGCSLDPDGGASLSVAKEYAPTPVKLSVLQSMDEQGFSYANYLYTYVTSPSLTETGTVSVVGLMYGPSGTKGVLDVYKALALKIGDDGVWKVLSATKGTPAAADLPPVEKEGEKAAEGAEGASSEASASEGSGSTEATK
jgi:hypothetical protein